MLPDDLKYRECCRIIDQLAGYAPMRLVMSGGEPLWRRDVFDLALRARHHGLSVTLETNGTLIDETMADRIHAAGIVRVAVCLDGSGRGTHDTFRGHAGAFDAVVRGLKFMRALGISTQINTPVFHHNAQQLPEMLNLAKALGVDAFHVFLGVPVACGLTLSQGPMMGSAETSQILCWISGHASTTDIEVRAITEDRHVDQGVAFISHCGEVFPLGCLPVRATVVDLQEQAPADILGSPDVHAGAHRHV
jgi:MoaA/NifB/PqqE/SkfB family radical SAM enzyme